LDTSDLLVAQAVPVSSSELAAPLARDIATARLAMSDIDKGCGVWGR